MAAPERFINFDTGQPQALRDAVNSIFGASGTNHAAGLVPDPGSTPGTTKFLREDASWQTIATVPIATTSVAGIVKPDGTTITVAGDGTIAAVTPTFTAPTYQSFTSGSANYTPTSGSVVRIKVRMVGGGGGGAAAATNAGSNGTDTSFGTWTAIHGNGGAVTGVGGNGGAGGANGTGTLIARFGGSRGGAGATTGVSTFGAPSGGTSPFGGSGGGGNSSAGGAAAANTGSGGGGGSAAGGEGGPGGSGEYVEFVVSAPGTIAYTVGGGGNGGAAGTQAGGNGAAGIILVEEFYV